MRFLHHCFVAVALFAIYSIATSFLTHTNPLGGIVVAVLAGSSAVLIDYLDNSLHRHRDAEEMARYRAYRAAVWDRRDLDSL